MATAANTVDITPTGLWPGSVRGAALAVTVGSTNAYVAAYDAGLHIVDITDPAKCVRVGGYNTRGHARQVTMVGDCALVADGTRGLQVIDTSNPTNCVLVGSYDTPGYSSGLAVKGDRVLLADGGWGVLALRVGVPGLTPLALEPSAGGLGPTGFALTVGGLSGRKTAVVSATANLSDWTPLQTNAAGPTSFPFLDPAATNLSRRYYRVEER